MLFALLVGWIAGGKFWRLGDARIRFGWLIFLPILLYLVSWLPPLLRTHWFAGASNVVERLALITLGVANWRVPGVKLIVLGLLLNFAAIVANGGLMPVDPNAVAFVFGNEHLKEAMASPHVRSAIMDTSTELGFLCDIIAARRPFVAVPAVYSIGDLVMSTGIFIAIIGIMRTPLPSEKRATEGATSGANGA